MSLLRDIQNAAISSEVEISTLLRKCKVLAARLGHSEFTKWVDQELNGYSNIEEIPSYRMLTVQSKGHFAGLFGSAINNGNIPLLSVPEKLRPSLSKSYCNQPISVYDALIKSSDGGNFQEQWPPDLIALYGENIYQNMNCLAAWKEIPHGSIVALIDNVRNKILNFVIEIESESPNAGEVEIGRPAISSEKVSQVFNTTIYGSVGNISDGSTNVKQTSIINVIKDDFTSLKNQLLELNIPESEINELEKAIKGDSKSEVIKNKEFGPKVTNWLGSLILKSAKGLIPIIQGLAANIITKAIFLFYGIE